MNSRRPVVLKFGGESLSDPELVLHRIRALRASRERVVVVVSAREGVTDRLKGVLDGGASATSDADLVDHLRERHPGLPPAGEPILATVRRLVRRVRSRPNPAPALRDELLSQGERLAAHWFAAQLDVAGIPATPVEADRAGLLTDGAHGAARVLLDQSHRRVRGHLEAILRRGRVPVVTGYFGGTSKGRVATLGRGGSDYSASALGAILNASRVELIKRNVSICTADPRLVPAARPVAHLSYEEAEEIAQFGAKVLHPVTIEPVQKARVELRVRSLNHRERVTSIGPAQRHEAARAVTLLGPLRLISLRIAGGRQRPGLLEEISRELARVHVTMASVVTTEAVLGLLVEPAEAHRARAALEPLAERTGAVLGHPLAVSLVSGIGEGILDELPHVPPSILRQALGLLGTARSISVVVPEANAVAALRRMHRTFVERPPHRPPRRTRVPRG
jgi:aspartokinase/homoserine dehydrogenase 1